VKRVGNKVSKMDLEKAMVLLHTALAIAIVIKQSRDRNRGRKGEPFRSAVSVLNHYLNDGGGLSDSQRATLEDIKEELRTLYEREEDEMMSPSGG
jgi:Flp pilus assembly protein TadB